MTADVHIALIGSGKMATVHARNIVDTVGAELAVVAGGSGASALAACHGAAHDEVEAAFTRHDVDAVVIASPNRFHAAHITLAAAGGKAVLVEKPVDLELDRVDRCIDAVGDAVDRVVVAFNRRFDPSFAAVRAGIDEGTVGDVEQVVIVSRDPAPPPLEYVPASGGIFRDMTIHDLDMARFLVGPIASVGARTQQLHPGIAELGDASGAVVSLVAASGALVTIVNARSNSSGYDQRLEVFGIAGTLAVGNPTTTLVSGTSSTATGVRQPFISHYGDRYAAAYRAEIAHLVDVTRGAASPRASLADGRAALALALASDNAARDGIVVAMDHTSSR